MGADLYIKSITEPAIRKYQPLFDNAVEERNQLHQDTERWQAVVQVRESIGGGFPALDRELQAAKEKVEDLKGKVQVAQKRVNDYYNRMYPSAGYYRDSYNGTSLLWRLELSWWKDIEGGVQTPAKLRGFLNKVKSRKLPPVSLDYLKQQHCLVDGKNNLKAWSRFYQNKKRRLIRFLERAIVRAEKGEEVYFSL